MAEHFGVHLLTVAGWLAAGCPGKRGAYDLEQISAWRNQPRQAPRGSAAASASAMLALAAAVNRLAVAIERTGSKAV